MDKGFSKEVEEKFKSVLNPRDRRYQEGRREVGSVSTVGTTSVEE